MKLEHDAVPHLPKAKCSPWQERVEHWNTPLVFDYPQFQSR